MYLLALVRGGSASGGVMIIYRPITPVPCDCHAALLKKCILVHIPIVGCVASEGNLAASTIASCALQEFFPVIGCAVSADKLGKSSVRIIFVYFHYILMYTSDTSISCFSYTYIFLTNVRIVFLGQPWHIHAYLTYND